MHDKTVARPTTGLNTFTIFGLAGSTRLRSWGTPAQADDEGRGQHDREFRDGLHVVPLAITVGAENDRLWPKTPRQPTGQPRYCITSCPTRVRKISYQRLAGEPVL